MPKALFPILAALALLAGAGAPNPAAACTSRHADSSCVRELTADELTALTQAVARLDAKVRTLVHDFAHLALELPQFTFHLTTDAAEDAIARCLDR